MTDPRICAVFALTALIASTSLAQTARGQKLSGSPTSVSVPEAVMERIFDEAKTPYKHGIVVRGEDGKSVDCPRVFRFHRKWYMHYVCMNGVGYETHLAVSDDLLQWRTLGRILTFRGVGWDQWQADGGITLVDPAWEGSYEPRPFRGKYWLSYIGGASQ